MSKLAYFFVLVVTVVTTSFLFVAFGPAHLFSDMFAPRPIAPVPITVAPRPIARATILFGGDMMFDRYIRSVTERKGGDFIFSCLDPLLKNEDLVVANLEGPITNNSSVSVGTTPGSDKNFIFTFPIATAELLYTHNVRMVNIGNNHIENFGADGVRATMSVLQAARVGYFGDPIDRTVDARDINGVSLAFISYNEFGPSTGSGQAAASTTIRQIQEAREQGKLPIVYTHWGIEYATTSAERIRTLARAFVDAGAEIVFGSHPHVAQEREFYSGKYIYYSLGNLIFDQYWYEDVRQGLMVRVVFDAHGVQYVEEVKVELMRDGRTCPVE